MNDHRVIDLPCGKSGDWEISRFKLDSPSWGFEVQGRGIPTGVEYTRLTRNNACIMSDTPAEWRDHSGIWWQAKGRVLIAGLGIGMILNAVAQKPEVTEITVVEKSPDVIKLVGPHYRNKYPGKVTIIEGDIFDFQPPKGLIYDVAWFDIWDNICADNYPEMKKLARSYGRKARVKLFWAKPLVMREVRQEREAEKLRQIFHPDRFFKDFEKHRESLNGDLKI